MKKINAIVVILLSVCLFFSCTDKKTTFSFLKENGYTEIKVGGFDVFAKGRGDMTSTSFTATNASGERVKGAVTTNPLAVLSPKTKLKIWGKTK